MMWHILHKCLEVCAATKFNRMHLGWQPLQVVQTNQRFKERLHSRDRRNDIRKLMKVTGVGLWDVYLLKPPDAAVSARGFSCIGSLVYLAHISWSLPVGNLMGRLHSICSSGYTCSREYRRNLANNTREGGSNFYLRRSLVRKMGKILCNQSLIYVQTPLSPTSPKCTHSWLTKVVLGVKNIWKAFGHLTPAPPPPRMLRLWSWSQSSDTMGITLHYRVFLKDVLHMIKPDVTRKGKSSARRKFPSAHVPNTKIIFKYVRRFRKTGSLLDTKT
jgi:hypothetical protein